MEAPLTFSKGNKLKTEDEILKASFKPWDRTDEETSELLWVMKRVEQEMLPAQTEYHKEWDDAKEIMEAVINPVINRPNIRIPWSHTVTDAALSEEFDAFPDIEIDTQEDDDKPKIPVINSAKDYALARTNWDKVKYDALRLRRIYGWCAVRIYFARETRLIKERIPVKGDDGMKIQYKETWDYPEDDIKIEVIDNPKRFLIDDAAHDIMEAEDCALFTEVSWNMFRQKVQHDVRYKNVDCVKPGAEYFVSHETGEVQVPAADQVTTRKRVKILEYWNKATDQYIMIANGVIIRSTCLVDDHKQLPFAVMHMYRRPHSFYSKGIPKLIESLEATYNSIIGAEVQATKLAFPIITTSDDAGIDPKATAPYPGIVMDGALGKMKLEQLGSVPAEAYRLKEKIEELIVWVTGINYQQLFSKQQSERVGIEALKKESMLSRVNSNLRENEANFIVRLGNLLIQDIMQYYPAPKVRKLMSNEDVAEYGKLSFDKDGKQLIRDATGSVRGVMERRKIPVKGVSYKEEVDSEGFKLTPLKSEGTNFILARPEYIRSKYMMDVRAVRPSAMGSSKEAKKLVLMELSNHALQVNQFQVQFGGEPAPADAPPGTPPTPGKPVWNIPYLEEQIAEINELSPKRALVAEGTEGDQNQAQRAFEKVAGPLRATFDQSPLKFQPSPQDMGMMGGAQPPPEQQQLSPQDQAAASMMVTG